MLCSSPIIQMKPNSDVELKKATCIIDVWYLILLQNVQHVSPLRPPKNELNQNGDQLLTTTTKNLSVLRKINDPRSPINSVGYFVKMQYYPKIKSYVHSPDTPVDRFSYVSVGVLL